MRFAALLLLFLTLAVVLIAFAGAALPLDHSVSRTVLVPTTQARVWTLISHVQDYPHWRTGIKSVDKLEDLDGRFHWAEHSPMGVLPQVLEQNDPPSHRVVRIVDSGLPFGGTWTFDLAPAQNGAATSITIREDGIIRNVFFRFLQRYIFGYAGTIEQYENDLLKAAR